MPIWLIIHLTAALPTLGLCLYIFVNPHRRFFVPLNILTLSTVVSGTVLSFAANASLISYCVRITFYLAVIGIAQFRLFRTGESGKPVIGAYAN